MKAGIKNLIKAGMALAVLGFGINELDAQCAKFSDAADQDLAENNYQIYRTAYKSKRFDDAYDTWKALYDAAPAADGKRFAVWLDGIEIYKHKLQAGGGDADMLKAEIAKLYDEAIACTASKGILLKNCADQACIDEKVGFLAGRKAFDMFYTLNSPYVDQFEALNMAIDKGGNTAEYIVLEPMAYVAVNQFAEKNIDKGQTRDIYNRLNAIADHNIANNAQFKAYYESAKARMNAKFDEIAANIFDCDYWKVKIKPEYDAAPNDPETLKRLIATLKRQACQAGDPLLDEMEMKYKSYAQNENARRQAEFEANNPAMMGKKAYDSGDYNGAIAKWEESMAGVSDPNQKAALCTRIAAAYKKLNQNSKAMEYYRKSLDYNPNSGATYISLGDMYVRRSRTCGKNAYDRGIVILAALNMYRQAKSKDPSMASAAAERIAKYSASKPPKEEVFMRGKKKGDRVSVPCIGGSVALDYAG